MVTANTDDVRATRGIVEPRACPVHGRYARPMCAFPAVNCSALRCSKGQAGLRDNDVRYLEGTSRSTGRQRRAVSGRNRQVYVTTTTCGIWKERAGRRDDNDVTGSDRST